MRPGQDGPCWRIVAAVNGERLKDGGVLVLRLTVHSATEEIARAFAEILNGLEVGEVGYHVDRDCLQCIPGDVDFPTGMEVHIVGRPSL